MARQGDSMIDITIAVQRLPHGKTLALPAYKSAGAAGMDLQAAIDAPLVIKSMARALVPSGLRLALPEGYEAQIRPRSGLAANHGITVLNSPGTIDSDYRGEIKVLLINLGAADHTIVPASRIAQMVIAPVSRCQWQDTPKLETSARGEGGFGSTGMES